MRPDQLYTGIVYDTLRVLGFKDEEILLSPNIKPLDSKTWSYGRAFTNRGRLTTKHEDYARLDAIRLDMYRLIRPGDVIVLQADDTAVAHAGDITCLIYQKLGAVGFLTDGIVRDSRRIMTSEFPCFCSGTKPIDALNYWAITEYAKPIQLPGLSRKIPVATGDMIYADNDGAIRIPKQTVPSFEQKLGGLLKREDLCRHRFRKIKSPEKVFDEVKRVFDKHGRW